MNEIWKFALNAEQKAILMPESAKIITAQVQHSTPYIWAIVNPTNRKVERRFIIVGTGNTFEAFNKKYIATFQLYDGDLVFHIFEDITP